MMRVAREVRKYNKQEGDDLVKKLAWLKSIKKALGGGHV
jgi:hypothetical protein